MKKLFWALMLAAATVFAVAGCQEKDPQPTPGNDDPGVVDPGKPEEPKDDTPDWCDYYFKIEDTCDETVIYGIGEFDLATLTDKNGKTIHEVLGFASVDELAAAVGTKEQAMVFDREVIVFGYDMGSMADYQSAYLTNGFGYWVDANSNPVGYGENSKIFIEWYDNEEGTCMATTGTYGVMNQVEGETLNACLVFQRTVGSTVTRAGLHVEVKVEGFVDSEAGKYTTAPGTYNIDIKDTFSLSAWGEYQGPSYTEQFEEVKSKLGLTTYEIYSNYGLNTLTDDGQLYTGLLCEGILPDGTVFTGTNAWLTADNTVTTWGADDAALCIEWFVGALPEAMYGHVCAMPSYYEVAEGEETPDPYWYYGDAVKAAVGKTLKITYKISYQPADESGLLPKGEPVIIFMNYEIAVTE